MSAPDRGGINQPGIYPNVAELDYHSDALLADSFGPSLSSTGAKMLAPPNCPAIFRHYLDSPRVEKPEFDLGHAVHAKILGVGLDIAVIPDGVLASNGATSTKAAREFIAEARERGAVPVKADVVAQVDAVAEAVLAYPVAAAILSDGTPEVSAYAVDQDTGVTMRARFDWLRDNAVVDLKTIGRAGGSNPRSFGKVAADLGYHIQAAWYLDTLVLAEEAERPFLHILAEVEPPHLVSVVQLDDEALAIGHDLGAQARHLYAACVESGEWPAWPDEIASVSLPTYYTRIHQETL